jgi:hypothetical protein
MKQLIYCLILLGVQLSACQKNSTDTPAPPNGPDTTGTGHLNAPGNISGSVIPATSITEVKLLDAGGKALATFAPDSRGEFIFRSITPGNYKLNFTPAAAYIKPNDIPVTLTGGQNLLAGAINVASAGNAGISGIIAPATAANLIYARNTTDWSVYFELKPDPNTGRFSVSQIPPGTYEIVFIAANAFVKQPSQTITVAKDQQADIGTVQFTPLARVAQLSCKVNGTAISWDTFNEYRGTSVMVTYTDAVLSIRGLWQSPAIPSPASNVRTHEINIRLENVTGPGTYMCDETTGSVMNYAYKIQHTMSPLPITSSKNTGGKATVIISSIDVVAKTITGSFTADLKPKVVLGGITGHVITDGVFSVKYP